jgi:hypothetical protein
MPVQSVPPARFPTIHVRPDALTPLPKMPAGQSREHHLTSCIKTALPAPVATHRCALDSLPFSKTSLSRSEQKPLPDDFLGMRLLRPGDALSGMLGWRVVSLLTSIQFGGFLLCVRKRCERLWGQSPNGGLWERKSPARPRRQGRACRSPFYTPERLGPLYRGDAGRRGHGLEAGLEVHDELRVEEVGIAIHGARRGLVICAGPKVCVAELDIGPRRIFPCHQ